MASAGARHDDASLDYVTNELMTGGDLSAPPMESDTAAVSDFVEAG